MTATALRLHSEASSEFEAVRARSWERNPEAALRFAEELQAALELIAENPRRAAFYPGLPEHLRVRRFVLRHFPYVLPYLVIEDAVFVLAIAHTHRQPGYWMRRLPNPP